MQKNLEKIEEINRSISKLIEEREKLVFEERDFILHNQDKLIDEHSELYDLIAKFNDELLNFSDKINIEANFCIQFFINCDHEIEIDFFESDDSLEDLIINSEKINNKINSLTEKYHSLIAQLDPIAHSYGLETKYFFEELMDYM